MSDDAPRSGLSIPEWLPPWPVVGTDEFLRVSASHVRGDSRWECPAQIAYKARPAIRVDRDPGLRIAYPPTETFALGMVKDAVTHVLTHGGEHADAIDLVVRGKKNAVPPPMRRVIDEAVTGYLATVERLRASGDLPPDTVVREFFAYDENPEDGPERIEWTAWGLLHISRDSALREYHVLTWDRAGERPRSPGYLAVYARVAADAVAMQEGGPWSARFAPAQFQPRDGRMVRVREIGLLDATHSLVHEATVDDARASFATTVSPHLTVLSGRPFQPGTHCASCAVRFECPGVARLPGLLGVAGESTWTRALAPVDLTAAMVCTWRVHLARDLGLPASARGSTPAMERGAAVHAWLERAHSRLVPCSTDDLPLPGVGEVGEMLDWSNERYLAVRPYLLQHVDACPLRDPSVLAAYPEWSMTTWDTDVDVVVSTRPDLVVDFPDRRVIRETKSVSEIASSNSATESFQRYPQVALALCMLADGLDPISGEVVQDAKPGVVELELLSAGEYEVRRFDAADPDTVLAARITIAEAVDRVVCETPVPEPGHWCAWCPVAQWCTARQEPSSEVDELGEPVAVAVGRGRVALLALAETPIGEDDDIPF